MPTSFPCTYFCIKIFGALAFFPGILETATASETTTVWTGFWRWCPGAALSIEGLWDPFPGLRFRASQAGGAGAWPGLARLIDRVGAGAGGRGMYGSAWGPERGEA